MSIPGRGKLPSIPPLRLPTCQDLRGVEAVAATTFVNPIATRHNEDGLAIVDVVSTGVVPPPCVEVGQSSHGALQVVLLHSAVSDIRAASVASSDDDAILKLDGTCLPENQYGERMNVSRQLTIMTSAWNLLCVVL